MQGDGERGASQQRLPTAYTRPPTRLYVSFILSLSLYTPPSSSD
jgi:hypothetical protein